MIIWSGCYFLEVGLAKPSIGLLHERFKYGHLKIILNLLPQFGTYITYIKWQSTFVEKEICVSLGFFQFIGKRTFYLLLRIDRHFSTLNLHLDLFILLSLLWALWLLGQLLFQYPTSFVHYV